MQNFIITIKNQDQANNNATYTFNYLAENTAKTWSYDNVLMNYNSTKQITLTPIIRGDLGSRQSVNLNTAVDNNGNTQIRCNIYKHDNRIAIYAVSIKGVIVILIISAILIIIEKMS